MDKKEKLIIKNLSGPKLSDLLQAIRLKRMDLANQILKEFLEKRGDNDETKQKV